MTAQDSGHFCNVTELVEFLGYVGPLAVDLFLQEVHLVDKEDEGGVFEGLVVDYGPEDDGRLFQSVLLGVLPQLSAKVLLTSVLPHTLKQRINL